jgi:hypothetical protein
MKPAKSEVDFISQVQEIGLAANILGPPISRTEKISV